MTRNDEIADFHKMYFGYVSSHNSTFGMAFSFWISEIKIMTSNNWIVDI